MTIAEKVKDRLKNHPRLIELVDSQTAIGLKKYGQTLDDNPKPQEDRIVHAIQECVDLLQYLEWIKLETDPNDVYFNHVLNRGLHEVSCLLKVLEPRVSKSLDHKEVYKENLLKD